METVLETDFDQRWKQNAFSCMVCGAAFSGGEKIRQHDRAMGAELPGDVVNDAAYREYVNDLVANDFIGRKVCIHGSHFTVKASSMECATLYVLLETKKPGNVLWAVALTELLHLMAKFTPKS